MTTQQLSKHEPNVADSDATIQPVATTTGIGEEARQAWLDVFTAHRRIIRETEKRLQEADLPSLLWYDVLFALYDSAEGRMKQSTLATAVQVSPSGMSRLVDRMVLRGLIERQEVPGDRRAAELVLTDAAVDVMREIWQVYGGVLAESFAPAAAGDEATISRVFRDTSDSLEGICRTRMAEEEERQDADAAA